MKRSLSHFVVAASFAVLTACAAESASKPPAAPEAKATASSSSAPAELKTILFFKNPNGRPCQNQQAILDGMQEQLKPLATVKIISTLVPEDMEAFEKWGIRGLPMLIVTDKTGKELHRFYPGVQGAETILAGLKK